MLAELIRGKTLSEVKRTAAAVKGMLTGEENSPKEDLGDLEALKGVRNYPVRIKCALLSWTTLIDAISARESGQKVLASTTE